MSVDSHSHLLDEYHKESFDELQGMLEDEGFLEFVLAQPATSFTESQQIALRRVANHIAPGTGGTRKPAREKPTSKKQRRTGAGKAAATMQEQEEGDHGDREPVDDWKPITDITEFTVNDDTLNQLAEFERNGTVQSFFTSQVGQDDPLDVWGPNTTNPASAFRNLLVNTQSLDRKMRDNRKVWLFYVLLWYHIKEIFAPGTGTGRTFSMGKNQVEELRKQIALIHAHSTDWVSNWDVEETLKHIRDWAKLGFKLNILTGEFGPGCIFVLDQPLTDSFLLRRITKSGAVHDAAIAHLRAAKLDEFLQEMGLDRYAEAILDSLLRPFVEAQRTNEDQDYGLEVSEDELAGSP